MIKSVTVDSQACLLLASEPVGPVKWTLSRISFRDETKTRLEERRSLGATLRQKLEYRTIFWDPASTEAARALNRQPGIKPLLCPCWPASTQYGAPRLATSGLYVTWEPEFSTYQIHTGTTVTGWTPSVFARTAPLLWGRWEKLPEDEIDGPELGDTTIVFQETGPAAYAITPAVSPAYGPTVQGETPPLVDCDHIYEKAKTGLDIEVKRERLGYGRDEVTTYHDHTPRRIVQMQAEGTATELMQLVAALHAAAGTVGPVWFPGVTAPCRLTANPSASTLVMVDAASQLGGHPYIILRNGYGADVARKIDSIAGNTLVLNAAPGAMDAESTSLQLLLLGRFRSDDLQIVYRSEADFTSQFALTELPPEYSDPAGEIYGSTHGPLAPVVYLFHVADTLGNDWYWTNYEAAVTVDGHTWEPKQIAWDQITEGLNMDDGTTTLKIDSWAGNPFGRLLRPRRGQILSVELLEWDLTAASATLLWSGSARSARASGRRMEVPVQGDGQRLLDQTIPRLLDGPTCPHVVYDSACGLSAAAKAVTGTLSSQSSVYVLRVAISGTYASHFFAGGWMTRANAADTSGLYAILDSTYVDSTHVDITVDQPLSPALTVGEAVTIYPGCDCTFAACQAHGNTANFGGSPYKPAANPAFVAIKDNTSSNSKK